mgnify:CR=1 FL=1
MTDQFHLDGAWNFRDVGGAPTAAGRAVLGGALFRASELSQLTDRGRQALLELGVTDVFDLRAEREIERTGADRLPDGVTLRHRPFLPKPDPKESDPAAAEGGSAPHEASQGVSRERGREFLFEAYSRFPTYPGAKAVIGELAATLADGGVALVHCAAGKDRTGWVVATVLRAAGVTDAAVLADYLRSNEGTEPLRALLAARYDGQAQLSDDLLGVREDYYRRAQEVMAAESGSFEEYLTECGIDAELLDRLRKRLLD